MPNDQFGDVYKYYQEFLEKFYGGEDLLSEYDREYYAGQETLLEERRKRMQERVMERLGAQGILASGVGSTELTELVDRPMAEAEASLDFQRMEQERQERGRRQGIALQSAFQKYQEVEEKNKSFWDRVGGMAGGAISGGITGAMAGGPWGALAGAALGAGGAAFGPGGGAGVDAEGAGYNTWFQMFLDQLNRGKTVEEIAASFPRYGSGY